MEAQFVARGVDRRQARRFYWGIERRSGFDRRATPSMANRLLLAIRDSPAILLTLLVCVNVMNVLDYVFTVGALEAGFAEGNPFMALLFTQSHEAAGIFKFVLVAAISIVMWRMRRYRAVLQAAVFAFGLFAAILVVHGYGRLFFY